MIFGRVKVWNQMQGWGFIETDDGEEYFFNISNIRRGQLVRERAKVKFDTEETQRGTEAINVSLA
tara:strand:+ start:416 stop:610 length:195 start_codon:yes stop_codon:yes gene_type:complete